MPNFIKVCLTGAAVKRVGARNEHEAGSKLCLLNCLLHACFLLGSLFNLED
jgi:hypothetical protein